jgi:hypothetical protein
MIHLDYNINFIDEIVEIYLDEINEPIEVDFNIIYSWAKINGLCSCVRINLYSDKNETMKILDYFLLPYDILKDDFKRYYLEKIIK